MNAKYDFVAGDTNSTLQVTVKGKQSKTVIDLTGATVRLRFSIGTASTVVRVMTINSPATAGIVQYQFVTGDLVAGTMTAAVEVTFADTTILSNLDTFKFIVRAKV